MKLKLFIIPILLVTISINGQEQYSKSIDSLITDAISRFNEISGLAITVVQDDKTLFTKAYGYSHIETKRPATSSTSFYIASATKSYVGLLASQLASEGRLDLNQSITNYKPIKDFKDNAVFKTISINDLLSHTSGISNWALTGMYASIGEYQHEDLIRILEDKTLELFNNKDFEYDNLGYNILDLILVEEFGISWKEWLNDELFQKLQMTNSSAYLSSAIQKDWDLASPYTSINDDELPKSVLTRKNDATMQAAGGLITSISDTEKWLLLNINEGQINGQQIFSKETINRMHTPIVEIEGRPFGKGPFQPQGYGLGWIDGVFNEEKVIYHSGGFEGFQSIISFMPKKKLGVAIFVNESDFGDNLLKLVKAFVYDLVLGKVNSVKDYDSEMEKLERTIDQTQKYFRNRRAERSKRQWKLSCDLIAYAGTYKNKNYGSIVVDIENDTFIISNGISKSYGEPTRIREDAIRVEFRNLRGRDIQFIIQNKKAVAAIHNGMVFYRE